MAWQRGQPAGGYVAYNPADSTYELPAGQAIVVADEDSPVFLGGAFETIASCYAGEGLPGPGYDLVCLFDALHDMGHPVGAARRIRQALAPDGTLLLVEPNAGDALEQNLNPVGRAFYGLSTVICTPGSLAQEVGLGLGGQAGERQLATVLREAGFGHVRRATETPFNIILEARP
jgi:SAM-dependent methyltransferase